jgi:hypothetical protein
MRKAPDGKRRAQRGTPQKGAKKAKSPLTGDLGPAREAGDEEEGIPATQPQTSCKNDKISCFRT